ncbi:MAG: tetratricopeptide repeat protein [Pirellulaceae bacterium]|nr:tetratricopeptide repeat protein [Pirellulaceae bacterium]
MADTAPPSGDSSNDVSSARQPLSTAVRKRLQQCFAHASKQAAGNNFDYATDLLSGCVLTDKNNTLYWQSFLGNLRKKYDNNKKGAKLASIRTGTERATVKKCQMRKDWDGVFKHGIEVLKINPWDVGTLMAMAAAGETLELDEVPLIFLRSALDAAPKDVDVNRAAAHALRARRQYDQAIACWRRVLEVKKDDEQANRAIGELATEKVIDKGGYEGAESSRQVKAEEADDEAKSQETARHDLSPEQKLERAIRSNPSDLDAYRELADLLCQREDYDRAVKVLEKAHEVSNQDPDIFERLGDAQLRGLRKKLHDLEAEFKKNKSPEIQQEWKTIRRQFDQKSLDRIKHLAERYPNNLTYVFQVGEAYQRVGQYKEAIAHFQKARNDPRSRGDCLLRLGQCFYKIKQPRLAATNLDAALAEITGQEPDLLKEALYWAGKLAMEMNDAAKAEGHLTTLAGLDYDYKDVAELLDKLAKTDDTE